MNGIDERRETDYADTMEALRRAESALPDFTSSYDGEISRLYEQIVNRPAFRYDPGSDPLYQSYDPDEKLREGFRFKDGRPEADGLICADCHRPFVRPLDGGYALNTGSVGNNLGGLPRAHALLLEGEEFPSPLRITILSVPYDNKKAAETADLYPDLPKKEAYQREVRTGIYSR